MIDMASPEPIETVAKAPTGEFGWRVRGVMALAILALTIAAMSLDWSGSVAIALGELVGVIAPVIVLAIAAWTLAALSARRR
jgi:hypothetical protein